MNFFEMKCSFIQQANCCFNALRSTSAAKSGVKWSTYNVYVKRKYYTPTHAIHATHGYICSRVLLLFAIL